MCRRRNDLRCASIGSRPDKGQEQQKRHNPLNRLTRHGGALAVLGTIYSNQPTVLFVVVRC